MGGVSKYGGSPDEKSEDPMKWNDFMAEDIYVCEQQQKSLSNPLFNIGPTAKYGESTVREFQKIIQRWMEQEE
ncbi:MAG: SRPBCC family protein [Bacteroidota bacterium]